MATRRRSVELTVTFDRELYVFDNEDSQTVVATAQAKTNDLPEHLQGFSNTEDVKIIGKADAGEFKYGLNYRLFGNWKEHPKYGWQFQFKTYVLARPHGKRGIVRYLKQCRGIGQAVAERIYEAYEDRSVEMLREEPLRVAATVHRLSGANAVAASEWLQEQSAIEGVKIDLFELFDGRGFQKQHYDLAINRWGNRAAEMIRKNPYLVLSFPSIGFATADKLYLDLGLDPNRLKRQALCLWHEVNSNNDGDTWLPAERCRSALYRGIGSTNVRLTKAIKLALRANLIVGHRDDSGAPWVSTKLRAEDEKAIARVITDSLDEQPQWPDALELDPDYLSEHQRGMLKAATQGMVGMLGGRPGCGKTVIAARFIRKVVETYGAHQIGVAAPTGKAAVRLTEEIKKVGVNSVEATTIHRMLVPMKFDQYGAGWGFRYGHYNPLPYKFIVVDEDSMNSTDIKASLLLARGEGSHILFVGDVKQLPPVGHGMPLRDMIEAGVPYGELKQIWRNSGRIVHACSQLRDTGTFDFSERIDLEASNPENLALVDSGSIDEQLNAIDSMLRTMKSRGNYDPKWHAQIICPTNKTRKLVNERFQAVLNPHGEGVAGNPFRVGDKVICRKNRWHNSIDGECNDEGQTLVCNGEVGEVVSVQQKVSVVELQNPYRVVKLIHGKQKSEEQDGEDSGKGLKWELAYGITGHSSQGSQWPFTFIIAEDSFAASMVAGKSWWYTTLSRAQTACFVVGRERVVMEQCAVDRAHHRKTFLQELIRDGYSRHLQQENGVSGEPLRRKISLD